MKLSPEIRRTFPKAEARKTGGKKAWKLLDPDGHTRGEEP
jgi:hypothetical protein